MDVIEQNGKGTSSHFVRVIFAGWNKGGRSPLFYYRMMVQPISADIARAVGALLERGEYVVNVEAGPSRIQVTVDSLVGVSIDECMRIHRALLSMLPESYTGGLEVTSPGAAAALMCPEQWETAVGRPVTAWTKDGRQLSGRLLGVAPRRGLLFVQPEGKKHKDRIISLDYDDIEKLKTRFS